MNRTWRILRVVLSAVAVLTVVTQARAFEDLAKMCRNQAAVAMNVSASDVDVRRGDNVRGDNYILLWDARLNQGRHVKGYCEADPRQGQIVRFERSEYPGFSRPGGEYGTREDAEKACRFEASRRLRLEPRDVGTDLIRSSDDGIYRIKWYTNRSYGDNSSGICEVDRRGTVVRFDEDDRGPRGGGRVVDFPRVRVDTDGHGTFDGGRLNNARIQRGYVDTRDRPSVAFSGHKLRITFYGEVENATSDREFSMRITGSDRGDAHGIAEIRLNSDRNEVETINLRGRINGDDFRGNFERNR